MALRDPSRGYIILEEQIANASMIRSFWGGKASQRVRGKTDAVRNFVSKQPIGYRDGGRITRKSEFSKCCELLSRDYVQKIPGYNPQHLEAIDLNALYPLYPTIDWRYCPIHIIHNEQRFGIPPIDLVLFRKVTNIIETKSFLKNLRKLSTHIQRAWEKVKRMLIETTTAGGLDFKFWERRGDQTIYSVRVKKNYRAHLVYWGKDNIWEAIAVGTHKEMGHG